MKKNNSPQRSSREMMYQEATKAAWLGIVVNLLLGVGKLVAGILAHSFALLSDALNSLGDLFASIVTVVALRIAQKPPDYNHPYGHSKAETVGAFLISQGILLSALWIAVEAVQRISLKHPIPPVWALWVAGGNVVIKEVLFRYKRHVGNKTNSQALLASAWDHRSDALSSMAVLVGLAVIRLGGPGYLFADEVAALVVVGMIFWGAWQLLLKSMRSLLDLQAPTELLEQIRSIAESHEEVLCIEKVRVREAGMEYMVELHVQVEPLMPVVRAHDIGHEVQDELLLRFPEIRDVFVHIEPFGEHDEGKK